MPCSDSQVLVVIGSLLETTFDRDENVREAAYCALKTLSKVHAPDIINTAISYRRANSKVSLETVFSCEKYTIHEIKKIINLIEFICDQYIVQLDHKLIGDLIEFVIEECLKNNELQFPAADIFTVIGKNYCARIIDSLMKHMENGTLPHPSVIYILGNLSTVNVSSFLPLCKSTLDFIASVLVHVKIDNLRKLYAMAISSITESIVEYKATNESAIATETYSPIIEEIFEIFTTSWLQSKDNKTCEAIVQSLSPMILLFSSQKLTTDASRIVATFLSLYKRSPALPRYSITLCIGNFIAVAPTIALQPILDTLLHSLHVMVWITPDFTQPLTIKNHSEVLRCYDHIGVLFPDKLCEIILRNLRSNSEQDKFVALLIATHLLGSSDVVIRPHATDLIITLHSLLNENSVKINKGLVKIVVGLACKEYLTEKDAVFIEFLVKHTHHNNKVNSETEELQSMCNDTIFLLSSTVPAVQPLCWKVLLQLLLTGNYNEATTVIARSLFYIVSKCNASVMEMYDSHVRPESVLARSLALLGSPLESNRGLPLLQFLLYYVPKYIKINVEVWNNRINGLIAYLETGEWNDNVWENIILDALLHSLSDDKTWIESLVIEISTQLSHYQKPDRPNTMDIYIRSDEQAMLYKFLALFTEFITDEQLIANNIDRIISPIQNHSITELKACAKAFGILSKSKLDQLLRKIEQLVQGELMRKSSRFLGLIKDVKHENETEIARQMICEYLSQAVAEVDPKILCPKLKYILNLVVTQINQSKNVQTRATCILTISKIAEVLNANQNICDDLDDCKLSLLSLCTSILESTNSIPDVTIIKILISITLFKPSFQSQEKLQILQRCCSKLFLHCTNDNKIASYEPVVQQICILTEEMIDNKSNAVLEELVCFLQPWISHTKECYRSMAILLLVTAIRRYIQKSSDLCENPAKFNQVGSLFGTVCIRAFEKNSSICLRARECILLLFIIIDRNEGNIVTESEIQNALNDADGINISDLLKVGCHKFPVNQLPYLVENLMDGLLDMEECCSLGASELLAILFSEIGNALHHHALDIFNGLLAKLIKLLPDSNIQKATIKVILNLGSHHRKMFLTTMLNQSLPLHINVCKCWNMICSNLTFTNEIVDNLLDIISSNPIYEDNTKKGRDKRNIATLIPLAALSALKEILGADSLQMLAKSRFADLFSVSLIMLVSYIGASPPINSPNGRTSSFIPNRDAYSIIPAKVALGVLVSLLCCVGFKAVVESLDCTGRIELCESIDGTVLVVISSLARSLANSQPKELVKVLHSLTRYSNSNIESQRIAVTTFCAEILNSGSIDEPIVDSITSSLLSSLSDTSPTVRQNSLKGLAAICNLDSGLVNRHYENVLSALTQGIDDDDASIHTGITLEALTGLSKLLPLLSRNLFSATFISIAVRIKPYFEKDDVEIRSMAIKLFGELANHVDENDKVSFMDQVNGNLVCFLLHLAENEQSVIKVCKYSLRAIGPLYKPKCIEEITKQYLAEEADLHYQEFLTEFTKCMVNEFPEMMSHFLFTAISYSKSNWPPVRAAAALFIGLGFSLMNETAGVPLDSVSCRLLVLLKDTDASVRAKAAYSLSLLF